MQYIWTGHSDKSHYREALWVAYLADVTIEDTALDEKREGAGIEVR
jgi:hypothetical protein